MDARVLQHVYHYVIDFYSFCSLYFTQAFRRSFAICLMNVAGKSKSGSKKL
jgi:hypothetical protein